MALRADSSLSAPAWRVVFLGRVSTEQDVSFDRLRRALAQARQPGDAGIKLEFVSAGGANGLIDDALVARAAASRPDLLVAPNGSAAQAARRVAPDLPLVFTGYLDPLRFGIVSDLLRRPEPTTGLWIRDDLDPKRIEILRDAYPGIRRVAVMGDRSWSENVDAERILPAMTRLPGLEITVLHADSLKEAQALLATPQARAFDAWCIPRSYLALLAGKELIETFRDWGKPAIFGGTDSVHAGAPLAYAPETSQAWPIVASLVRRIRQGERAGNIPIEQPQRFVLAVRTTPDINVPLASISVVRRADVVVR
jgi:putative ABC transport system substrate-binding protein